MSSTNMDFISDVTPSFYGISIADSEGEELLNEFKALLGINEEDPIPDTSNLYADPYAPPSDGGRTRTIKEIYVDFLNHKLQTIRVSEAVNAISLEEAQGRDIIFAIFSMAVEMLGSLQDCMRVQSELIKMYADWQAEYTDLISQTPIYGPLCKNLIIADDQDFGSTSLGYANTTVRQVTEHLLEQLESETYDTNGIRSVSWPQTGTFLEKSYTFTLIERERENLPSLYSIQISAIDSGNVPHILLESNLGNVGTIASATLSGLDFKNDITNKLMSRLTTNWNDLPSFASFDMHSTNLETGALQISTITPTVFKEYWSGQSNAENSLKTYLWGPWNGTPGAWPETILEYDENDYEDGEINQLRNASSSFRAEVNAQLQLYIQNVDSRKQRVRDMSKTTETIINSTREAIQAQANLLTAITESLRSLISAIFR